jgi:hypothetical protein
MNKKQRRRKEKEAKKKALAAKLQVALTETKPANNEPTKEARNEQANSDPLKEQPMSRWSRFKKWLTNISVAEVVTVLLTAAIAGTTVFYTVYSKKLVRISQRSFEASNRPYIGVDGIAIQHDGIGSDGKPFHSPHPTPQTNSWTFSATIKNFGTVSGTKFIAMEKIFIDGKELTAQSMPGKPFTMFPNQTIQIGQATFREPLYREIMDGKKQLEVEIFLNYDGVGGPYSECQKGHYEAELDRFINLGVCP